MNMLRFASFFSQALLECPAASAGLFVRLDLADNTLGEEGGSTLAQALSNQPNLTYINLRDCSLEVRITAVGVEVWGVCIICHSDERTPPTLLLGVVAQLYHKVCVQHKQRNSNVTLLAAVRPNHLYLDVDHSANVT